MKNRVAVSEIRKENKNNDIVVADSAEPRTITEFKDLGLNIIEPRRDLGVWNMELSICKI